MNDLEDFTKQHIDLLNEQIKLLIADKAGLIAENKELKDKNEILTAMLLKEAGLLNDVVPVMPTSASSGREPWYRRQKRLEELFRKDMPDASQE